MDGEILICGATDFKAFGSSSATSDARRVLIIRNPVAGQARRGYFSKVVAALDDLGCQVTVVNTSGPRHAEVLAARARGFEVIVAAGGDGTINEILNGLPDKAPPLAVIPMGTANVLAVELGLGDDPMRAARAIAFGTGRKVYPAIANGRKFLLMTGAGFDAWVVEHVSSTFKRRLGVVGLGKLAYVWATLLGLFRFSYPGYRVTVGGQSYEAATVIAAKSRFYGGGYQCAPDVRLTEPELHICLAEGGGAWNTLRYAVALAFDRFHLLPDVKIIKTAAAQVEGREGEAVQGDGDVLTVLPLELKLCRKPIRLIYPE